MRKKSTIAHKGAVLRGAGLLSNRLEFSVHLAQGTGAAEHQGNSIIAK